MRMLNEYDAAPDEGMTPEVEAFYEMGRSIDELTERVDATMLSFRHWSLIAGGMIGLALGCRLIRLSVKRTRKTYEIEPAACVACGKCFNYCPQNKSKIKYEPQNLEESGRSDGCVRIGSGSHAYRELGADEAYLTAPVRGHGDPEGAI